MSDMRTHKFFAQGNVVEFRTQTGVVDLVLCGNCGHYGITEHLAECVELPAPIAVAVESLELVKVEHD